MQDFSNVPGIYQLSQDSDSLRIRSVGRPALWVNLLIGGWLIGWTYGTIQVYCSYLGISTAVGNEQNSLGDVLGFSFFWISVFLFVLLINFAVIEIGLHSSFYEQRFGLPGMELRTNVDQNSIQDISLTRKIIDDGESNKKFNYWTLCISGNIQRKIVFFGKYTPASWRSRQLQFKIAGSSTKEEVYWLAKVLSKWSGKLLRAT